jgi:hypothetical protein
LKLEATYVSAEEFDDLYFHVSFGTNDPGADFDIQRQFEDDDGGVCYIETHEPDRYAGHFRLRLVEFASTRLVFDIDGATDRRFRQVERIVCIIFGVKREGAPRYLG